MVEPTCETWQASDLSKQDEHSKSVIETHKLHSMLHCTLNVTSYKVDGKEIPGSPNTDEASVLERHVYECYETEVIAGTLAHANIFLHAYINTCTCT